MHIIYILIKSQLLLHVVWYIPGWFTQSDEPHCKKEYNYSFNINNPGYVEWAERETRGNNIKYQTSLVYVGRPFRNAIDVTERRNLVYNFRFVFMVIILGFYMRR